MKKISALILFIIPLCTFASDTLKFWVQFADKAASPYSINRPEEFLSKRAIERRQKFNIQITEQDFPVNPAYIQQVAAAGVKVLNTSRWLNGATIQTADEGLAKKLMALPFVKTVEKVAVHSDKDGSKLEYLMEMLMSIGGEKEDGKPIDESAPPQEYYGNGYGQAQMLNGIAMHQMGYTGRGVVIAVLDGGFMSADKIPAFAHLFQNRQLLGTWDFVKQDSNVFDDNNHGMNVLSCMAAKVPGQLVGTAPDAMYWLLRTEDANTEYAIEEYNWASGAEFADSAGADIINSSLGYTQFDDETMNYSYRQLNGKNSAASRAAAIAASKGIIICNAAGNEGNETWQYIGAPADAEGIITVGGVNPDSTHTDFSSYGPTADGRLAPTLSAQATQVFVASVSGFYASQGTSFASPILCGAIACLKQANPDKSVTEIINALQKSAHRFYSPDTAFGYGIPDVVKANRILGSDKTFDYKKDAIETAPPAVLENATGVIFYISKKQKAEVKLVRVEDKRTIHEHSDEFTKGFNQVMFTRLDGLKPGKYQMLVKIGKQQHSFDLTKE